MVTVAMVDLEWNMKECCSMQRNRFAITAGALVVAGVIAALPLARATIAPGPAESMATAAAKFLASLNPDQRKRALFKWSDASRLEWHFIPMERTGLPFKQLDAKQRGLAHAFLKTGLSRKGYLKATQVIELEKVLAELEKNPVRRDPELYYFWVYGTPDPKGTWGWKLEGHHLSLNFTVVKGAMIATTPTFMGANPGEVRQGPLKGRRVLRAEEDIGRALVLSFDQKMRSHVIFETKAPADILTGSASRVDPLAPAGLSARRMNAKQQELLRRLLQEYAAAMPAKLALERLAKIEKAGFEKIHFAWAGGTGRGEPHYYRLQGPTFLIEYDNTQNDANHIHTVWRDFEGDFGRDLLREHLKAVHAK
jgi:hypothetical protein